MSFNFMVAVTNPSDFVAQENKIFHCFYRFSSICYEVMGPDVMILVFWMLNFKPAFSLFFHLHQEALHFLPLGWCHLRLLIFLLAILSRIRATKLHHWTQNWKEMRKTILMSWHRQIQHPTSYAHLVMAVNVWPHSGNHTLGVLITCQFLHLQDRNDVCLVSQICVRHKGRLSLKTLQV